MKKILTLIMLMLLSITTVDAQNPVIHFWGNSHDANAIDNPKVGNSWVYKCKGSQFDTWNIVSSNKIYFKPYFNWEGSDRSLQASSAPYETSGQFYEFRSDISDSGDASAGQLTLPTGYADYDFKFEMYNISTNSPYTLTVKVTWDKPLNVKLESTVDSWTGTPYQNYNDGLYTWTWSKQMLNGIPTGTRLEFNLDESGTNYGPSSSTDVTGAATTTTIQVQATNAPYLYAWETSTGSERKINGDWPGTIMTKVGDYWTKTFDYNPINIVLNNGNGSQTGNLTGLSGTVTYNYNGSNTATQVSSTTNGWFLTTDGSSNKFYLTHQKGQTYDIQAKKENGKWIVMVTVNEADYDYYWVSPEITNNQKWEYFKMVPSRHRQYDGNNKVGDGKISDKYFSFTIKDDDLKNWDGTPLSSDTKIRWYVVRDDDAKWFRPTENVDRGTSYEGDYTGPNNGITDFSYNNFEGIGTTTNRDTYISFSKGARKSYTFILNAKPSDPTNLGNLYVDSPIDNVGNTAIDYYLIGNFSSASGNVPITIDKTRKMDKLWYKNGTEYNSTNVTSDVTAAPDSVVYQYYVKKPNEGWGDLYLLINPGDNNNNEWKYVYRPLISLYNCLDGRALVGGLTKAGVGSTNNGANRGDQSLNPEPSDFYSGYTLRFNATTMTYHLEFHTSLYLVGTGVKATVDGTEMGGEWNLNAANARIPLNATQDSRHFRNTVRFNRLGQFRFVLTEDESQTKTYKVNWSEDGHNPLWFSLGEDQAHYNDKDSQYKNYLHYTENGSATSNNPTSDGTNNVVFDLVPDTDEDGWGEFVINFYNYGDASYYTIERKGELRDYNEVKYKGNTRNILGRNDYKFFCVWSDYIAWNKPDDVDVYTVTQFNPSGSHAATVTLSKQNISYIPAKKAVILAMKTDKDKLKGGMVYDAVKPADLENNTGFNKVIMDMTPYATPDATVSSGVPEFKPLYESTELSRYEDVGGTPMANYLFGFYHANHVVAGNTYDNADFLLGFWQTTGNGNTYPNSGFLQLTREQADLLGVGASYTITDGGAGAPAFLLLFDDEDSSVVTGIRDLNAEVPSVKDSADDHWYTLSGVRITQPTAKGIYIHGGKKVIVR